MIPVLIVLIVLFAIVMAVLNSSYVQTKLGQWAASHLSEKLNAEVGVDRLEIDFFNKLELNGVIVYDQNHDTLFYAQSIYLSVRRINFKNNLFRFGDLKLTEAELNIKTLDTLGRTNMDFLTNYFNGDTTVVQPVDTSKVEITLSAKKLLLENCNFSYLDRFAPPDSNLLKINDFAVRSIDGDIQNFQFLDDTLRCEFRKFNLYEKSGLRLDNLAGKVRIDPSGIHAEEIELVTPYSEIHGDVALLQNSWSDYSSFIHNIKWDSKFDLSTINLRDIGFFTTQLQNINFPIYLEGDVWGPIDNIKGRKIKLTTGSRSIFRGSFDVSGLPDAENAYIDLRVKQLSSDYHDLASIANEVTRDSTFSEKLPIELQRAGSIFFEGSFTGFPQDFVAYGSLTTEAGRLDLDLNLVSDSIHNGLKYNGGVKTKNLDMGRLLDIEKMGSVTANAQITAFSQEKLVSGKIDGTIERFNYSGYDYENLKVNGTVSNKMFQGKINSKDPNLNFDFQGIVDFSSRLPLMNFKANIYNADLTALHLVNDSNELSFSTNMTLNAQGITINEINGSVQARNSYICYGDSVLYLKSLKLNAAGDAKNRIINFISDVVDISLIGAFDIDELPHSITNLVGEVMPSFVKKEFTKVDQNFDFNINFKKRNLITGLLLPKLEIASGTTAYGSYNSIDRSFSLFLRSAKIAYDDYEVHDFSADMGKQSEVLKGKFFASRALVSGFEIENVDLDAEAYNDIVQVGFGWLNKNKSVRADIDGQITFLDEKSYVIDISPSYVGSESAIYKIENPTRIRIDSTHISVDNLVLDHKNQKLEINGSISEDKSEELTVLVKNFDFATLDSMGIDMATSLHGIVNLQGSVRDFYGEKIIKAHGTIDSLSYGEYALGDVAVNSRYFGEENKLGLDGALSRGDEKILDFKGDYKIGAENPLNGKLTLEQFNLNILNLFNIPQINHYSGYANGEIKITGKIAKPVLDGYIDFDEARFLVEYVNTYFTFSDRVRVEDGWFGIDYKPLYDDKGHKGFVVASAFHEDYSNWSYDVSVEANDFFIMNTTREMNSTYFGTAYGTGTIQLGGYEDFLEINIDAKTEKGTSLKLPLDETEDVTLENFVHFVTKSEEAHEERKADLSGVQLRLNIDATPDAEVQLIFDQKSGDIIRSRGSGKMTFEISQSGEFLMFGRYEIQEGSYLFTLKNLINKQFQLRKGGTIGWYGDPYNADIDISATYQLRTPLYPIMVENQDNYRGREDVNVVLNLSEKLLNPAITFDIELPQATETERSQLASITSTTQQLNQQVFSLLILNRFLPVYQTTEENQAISGVSGLGSATTSDFISSQISGWLSEISNEFDIGINYRPGDQISNQEIAVALSTQLFNERLRVRGNFGVTSASESQYTQSQTNIVGDFLVEYSLTADGKIRLKVFNETNPYEVFSTSSSIYTQGIGLVYQEDFDTLDEFFNEIKGLFTRDKVTKEEKSPQP